jgi:predicted dehydrogenase
MISDIVKTINVSVIGCGVWGSNHARVYKEVPSINLQRAHTVVCY